MFLIIISVNGFYKLNNYLQSIQSHSWVFVKQFLANSIDEILDAVRNGKRKQNLTTQPNFTKPVSKYNLLGTYSSKLA